MEIFISWTGAYSKRIAEKLHEWLPCVINATQPWLSAHDIESGSRWNEEIAANLHKCNFGIICLTNENLHSDWILFEAGALSKNAGNSRTWTLLLDLQPSDVAPPLSQFQHTSGTKEDIFKLLQAINKHLDVKALPTEQLAKSFEKWWPELEATLSEQKSKTPAKPVRSDREILEEILESVRIQTRSVVNSNDVDADQQQLNLNVYTSKATVLKCGFCQLVQFENSLYACRRCEAPFRKDLLVGDIPDTFRMKRHIQEATKECGLKRASIQHGNNEYIVSGLGEAGIRYEFSIPYDQELSSLQESIEILINDLYQNSLK